MINYVIPTVGTRGKFTLSAPLDQLMLSGEEYTVQAVRKLADYIANNEDPLKDIYTANGLSQTQYAEDLAAGMFVASLQSETGHWVYVPAKYIQTYPDTNGVPYRTLMMGVSLGAMPVEIDLDHLKTAISNLVRDSLGVTPQIKLVETSKALMVSRDKHDSLSTARQHRATLALTDSGRYQALTIAHERTLAQLASLQAYVASLAT